MENIFNFIITKIIVFLNKDNLCSTSQYEQMYYGLQILSYNVMVTLLILIFAAIIHCFLSSLLVFIVFGTFRIVAGGYHFNSMWKCIFTTTAVIIGSGKCAQLIGFSFPLTIVLCIILDTILLSYTPRGTKKNPYTDSSIRLHKLFLRITTIIITLLALFISQIRSQILLAMIFVVIFLFPVFIDECISVKKQS